MTSTSSQKKNDCVIVAIANATGLSYDEIAAKLTLGKRGINHLDWTNYLKSLGWYLSPSVPRRGQDKITGIVRMISNKKATGHLVYMKNGIIFDSFAPNGMPIKEYQSKQTKYHIQQIWRREVKIDIRLTPVDTDVPFDFLASLEP